MTSVFYDDPNITTEEREAARLVWSSAYAAAFVAACQSKTPTTGLLFSRASDQAEVIAEAATGHAIKCLRKQSASTSELDLEFVDSNCDAIAQMERHASEDAR